MTSYVDGRGASLLRRLLATTVGKRPAACSRVGGHSPPDKFALCGHPNRQILSSNINIPKARDVFVIPCSLCFGKTQWGPRENHGTSTRVTRSASAAGGCVDLKRRSCGEVS